MTLKGLQSTPSFFAYSNGPAVAKYWKTTSGFFSADTILLLLDFKTYQCIQHSLFQIHAEYPTECSLQIAGQDGSLTSLATSLVVMRILPLCSLQVPSDLDMKGTC